MSRSDQQEFYKLLKQLGMLTFIPMILVSGPLAGFFLGRWIDLKWKTGAGLTAGLVLLGFLAAARESFKIIRRVSREK